jgi:hypothetical protein
VYARYGGAGAVFPAEWVVTDVAEAAGRILEHAENAARRRAGELARANVIKDLRLAGCRSPLS